VGYGLDPTAQMGPVISAEAKAKIIGYIDGAEAEGAEMLVDGRGVTVPGYEKGFFVGPTLMNIRRDMAIAREEVFGPTLGIIAADGLDDAIDMIHENPHGNAASIFTPAAAPPASSSIASFAATSASTWASRRPWPPSPLAA
jgi:malonate-semialdehyde dehydrogenase (acetylating)/methylmalonate-semialdehyde dehydrogenase